MSAGPASSIRLRRTHEDPAAVDAAVARFGDRVGIAGVLAHLNRTAAPARVPGTAVEWGFGWNAEDARTERWWPQGITTSADAGDPESVGGRRLVLTSWYARSRRGANLGSRVSVIDLDTLEYRHVLLVVPERVGDRVELRPLRVHAGGLVWCGPYLHVAGTRRGLSTCRVDDVIRVASVEDAFGYRFVLPVRFGYQAHATQGVEPLRYSFLSLDRGSSPPELLAGEYGRAEMSRRLVGYPLDPETLHLATHTDDTSRPRWLDERGPGHMQGTVRVGDTCYITASRGRHRTGQLYVGTPGRLRRHPGALPVGPEDITYWPSTDRLWSLSEYPGHRFVFSVARAGLH